MLKIRSIYYLIPIRRTMEDLTDAITSLKCLLEEQLCMKEYALVDDSPFLAMKKELTTTHKELDYLNRTLNDVINSVDQLYQVMEDIKDIQKQALKWQEMSQ